MKIPVDLAKNAVKIVANQVAEAVAKEGANVIVNKAIINKSIRIPSAAQDYVNRNYLEVIEELKAYGFTNIATVERKDLIVGLLTKNGSIAEISINGKADFKKNSKHQANSRVVIIYHTYNSTIKND